MKRVIVITSLVLLNFISAKELRKKNIFKCLSDLWHISLTVVNVVNLIPYQGTSRKIQPKTQ